MSFFTPDPTCGCCEEPSSSSSSSSSSSIPSSSIPSSSLIISSSSSSSSSTPSSSPSSSPSSNPSSSIPSSILSSSLSSSSSSSIVECSRCCQRIEGYYILIEDMQDFGLCDCSSFNGLYYVPKHTGPPIVPNAECEGQIELEICTLVARVRWFIACDPEQPEGEETYLYISGTVGTYFKDYVQYEQRYGLQVNCSKLTASGNVPVTPTLGFSNCDNLLANISAVPVL